MADITSTLTITISKNNKTRVVSAVAREITMTGNAVIDNMQSIGTSAEALALGDVTAPGYAYFHNCDATNFVQIGYDDTGFVPFLQLLAGEDCIVYFDDSITAPYAKADTAAVLLDYIICQQ